MVLNYMRVFSWVLMAGFHGDNFYGFAIEGLAILAIGIPNGWMVFLKGSHRSKWMMTGCIPDIFFGKHHILGLYGLLGW